MPVDSPPLPVQIHISILFLGGIAAFIYFFFVSKTPKRIDPHHSIPGWRLNPADFFAGLLIMMLTVLTLQVGVARLLRVEYGSVSPEQMVLLGATTHLGALAVLFAFSRIYREKFQEPLNRTKLSNFKALSFAAFSFLAVLPIISLANLLWQLGLEQIGFEPIPQDVVELFLEIERLPTVIVMILVTVVLAPISEEVIFRGGIYRFLKDKIGMIGGFAVSGLLFAILHQSLSTLLPLFLLGVALAYSYEKTGNLKVPILFHAIFNANTVFVILLTESLG